jgi:hypothetical protein
MKMIVLALVLAAAGCSKKSSSDCEPAITKGMDAFLASVKNNSMNPQMQERITGMADRMKTVYIKHCTEDKWAPEVVACYGNMKSFKDRQECDAKLTDEQKSALRAERRSGPGRGGMADIPGHPQGLSGGSGGSAEAPGAAGPGAAPPAGAPPAATPPSGAPTPAAGSEPPSAAGTPPPPPPPAGSGK